MIKGFRPTNNNWSIENAFESRQECIARLQKQLEKIRETNVWAERDLKPGERTKFRMGPALREISREMYMFQEIKLPAGIQERSSVSITVWCLPVGVDPNTTGDR